MSFYWKILLLIVIFEAIKNNSININLLINYEIYMAQLTENIKNLKERLTPLLIKIGYNLLYSFSVCQIEFNKIKNIIEPKWKLLFRFCYKYLKDKDLILEPKKKILILLDNDGNNISSMILSNRDAILFLETSCRDKYLGNSSLILFDKNYETGCINHVFYEKIPTSFDYKVSNVTFMAIELEHDDKTHVINLKDNTNNYYIVNNSLNKNFFKYYIKNVLKSDINNDNFDYKVTIIDHNVKIITLLPHQYILIEEHNYKIYPDENENITYIIENIITNVHKSDSDKSYDFVKLENN